jgi:AcrR family transcriptional regulator
VQTTESNVPVEPFADARDAILHAARGVAQRDGIKQLTLDKVAAEANVPTPIFFAQFPRKKDLLLWVAADSLAAVARSLTDIDWTDGDVESRHESRRRHSHTAAPRWHARTRRLIRRTRA